MMRVRIAESVRRELHAYACAALPREACGVLIGDARGAVVRATRARNLAVAADRFEIDPLDLARADAEARAAGLLVLGVWHSHADGTLPSRADREAAWAGWVNAIVSARDGAVAVHQLA